MYAKSILFSSFFSHPRHVESPEFLSKYLLFDDALHTFFSLLSSSQFCTFRQCPSFKRTMKNIKFSIFEPLRSLFPCPVQRKISNYFRSFSLSLSFVQTDVFPTTLALNLSKLNKYMRTWKFAAAASYEKKDGKQTTEKGK